MNITFLAGYFLPEKSADTHLNANLLEDFSLYGANINVIVPFPNRGLDEEEVEKCEELRQQKINERLIIRRIGKKSKFKNGLLARSFSLFKKTIALYKESRKYKTDCYFIVSSPPFLGYLARSLSKKAPVVYKLQDVFPDNLIKTKKMSEKNFFVKILRRLEKDVYNSVSCILVCSEDVKKTLLSRGVSASKISVVHDWIDGETCVHIDRDRNPLFDEFGINRDDFIFCYAGNIGHMQNIDTIISAAKILKEKAPRIKIVIIGEGACKQAMLSRIETEDIPNIVTMPMQPLERVSMVYSLGNVGLVSLKKDVSKTALPSKTWSIMSAGTPVLCEIDLDCELANIIESQSLGFCVPPGDADAMAEKMIQLYKLEQEELRSMGGRCREYILENLNRKQSTLKCFNEIKKII